MKLRRPFMLLVTVLLPSIYVVILLAVFWKSAPAAQTEVGEDSQVYLPMVNSPMQPIIPDTTNVLTEDSNQHLVEISPDGWYFTFAQNTPELQQVDPGEIIVSDVSEAAPAGYLRTVISKQSSGGQIILKTRPATLVDAIQQGTASFSRQLTPGDIEEASMLPGVSIVGSHGTSAPVAELFVIEINNVLLNGIVQANGTVRLDTRLEFDLTIEDWELKELHIVQHAVETANLKIVASVKAEVNAEVEIAHYRLRPIRFKVGFVPIVVFPELSVYVGVDGSVSASLTTGATQMSTMAAGAHYENGEWNTVNEFSNSFQGQEPTFSASLEVKAYAGAGLELTFYTLAPVITEVELKLNVGLKLEAEFFNSDLLCWTLKRTLDGQVELEIEIIGTDVAYDYKATLFQDEAVLLHGERCGVEVLDAELGAFAQVPGPWPSDNYYNNEVVSETFSVAASISYIGSPWWMETSTNLDGSIEYLGLTRTESVAFVTGVSMTVSSTVYYDSNEIEVEGPSFSYAISNHFLEFVPQVDGVIEMRYVFSGSGVGYGGFSLKFYDPDHPNANRKGWVWVPGANRSIELNSSGTLTEPVMIDTIYRIQFGSTTRAGQKINSGSSNTEYEWAFEPEAATSMRPNAVLAKGR